jgi:hypothetical protein
MNTPIPAPLTSRFIPVPLLQVEAAIEPFLGDDLAEVCAAAAAIGEPLFVCTAAFPHPRRLDAVCQWRKRAVVSLFGKVPAFSEYFNAATAPDQAAIREGKVPLSDLETAIANHAEEIEERRRVAREASKAALRQAVRNALRDCDAGDSESRAVSPGYLAILETGEVGLFRLRGPCIEWGRGSGVGFLFGAFDPLQTQKHLPAARI